MYFYKAQKNIAKILETQYDYSFLIPLIGEILDSFVKDYFVYIFMKDESDTQTDGLRIYYEGGSIMPSEKTNIGIEYTVYRN